MTSLQDARIKEFEIEVRKRGGNAVIDWKESNISESRGILFGTLPKDSPCTREDVRRGTAWQ